MKIIAYIIYGVSQAYIIYGVSQILYKLFGYNTPSRKANEIQEQLDYEHHIKDVVNARTNGNYTTKKAIEVAKYNDWI